MRNLRILVFNLAAIFAGLPGSVMSSPAISTLNETRLRELGPAPRLFASAADWAALHHRLPTDAVSTSIYRATRQRASALLAGSVLEHKKIGVRRLDSARLLQGRILDLATVARLDHDPSFAALCAVRARDELLAAAALPDWGPGHFLDVAEYALGVAIGLDWLHDTLSSSERDLLAQALIDQALRPSYEADAFYLRWLGGKSNWTQVCHAGLTAAALAVADREPALAARTITRAIADQTGPNAAYAPDGVYPEGPVYWGYGTTFEVILISLLQHSFATDYGLSAYPGVLASADYLTQITGPTGRYFNYADSREFPTARPVLHWFATARNLPGLAAPEILRLAGQAQPIEGELQFINKRHDALALWWHPVGSASSGPASTAPLPLAWLGRGENPVAVFRSAWNDPRATYLAIKGGSPSTSHAHMDAGAFILEARGVRWAVDLGMQDYESLESAGIKLWDTHQAGERWSIFRIGPESHNILRFDRALQRVDGHAAFTVFEARAPAPSATLDLTRLYRDQVSRVTRQASLQPDGSIRLQDEWLANAQSVEVAFQWLTYADITVESSTVVLRQSGETLRLRIESSTTFEIKTDDVSTPARPFDAANPGLRRLRILLGTPANQPGLLRITASTAF